MNSKELLLGLILLKEEKLTKDQLKKALLKQGEIRRFGRHQRLGEVIVKLGFMTDGQLEAVLELQSALLVQGADHTPLGLLIIEHGLAQPSQVYDALVERQFSESRLGELLVEKGFFTQEQLLPLIARQEQEREAAAVERAANPPPATFSTPAHGQQATGPLAPQSSADDDFVVFDAGGNDDGPQGPTLYRDTAAKVPMAPPAGDLLFKSYLDE